MKIIALVLAVISTLASSMPFDVLQQRKMYACMRLYRNINGEPAEEIAAFDLTQADSAAGINMNGTIGGLPRGLYVLEVHEKNESSINCNSLGPIKNIVSRMAALAYLSVGSKAPTLFTGHLESPTLVADRYTSIIDHPIGGYLTENFDGHERHSRNISAICGYVYSGRCGEPSSYEDEKRWVVPIVSEHQRDLVMHHSSLYPRRKLF